MARENPQSFDAFLAELLGSEPHRIACEAAANCPDGQEPHEAYKQAYHKDRQPIPA